MGRYVGKVLEFRRLGSEYNSCVINCPPAGIPDAGQYVLVHHEIDDHNALAQVFFSMGPVGPGAFIPAAPIPRSWSIGECIQIYGPLGNGFKIPAVRHLGVFSLGNTIGRLIPLIDQSLKDGTEVALFNLHAIDLSLSPEVEVNPIGLDSSKRFALLEHQIEWMDFLVVDVPLENLDLFRRLHKQIGKNVPGQVLVETPMPCGGVAECGVCALPGRKRVLMACVDGPVFDIKQFDLL